MVFPALRSSTNIAFLDDDEHFIDAMGIGVQRKGRLNLFPSPAELDEALSDADQLARDEQKLLARIENPRNGFSSIAEAVEYFRWSDRHKILTILLCDHAMPAEPGVSVCSRHAHHGFRRVLLTGVADAKIAIDAFNGGHIESFLPKQHRDLPNELLRVVDEQVEKSMEIRGSRLAAALTERCVGLLRRPGVFVGLADLLADWGATEYLVVPDPFGILGLCAGGRLLWIQIEDEHSMGELVETLKELDWPDELMESARSRQAIPNVEIAELSGLSQGSEPAHLIAPESGVYAAVFELPRIDSMSHQGSRRGIK